MKKLKNIFLVSCGILISACSSAQKSDAPVVENKYYDCPQEGSANSPRLAALNENKNRKIFPLAADMDTTITLKKLLEPGNDKDRWKVSKAVSVIGYVYDVKPGGVETCNCKEKEIDGRDTHIEIVLDAMDNGKTKRVIVEVTPRIREIMKAKGEDWSTKKLRSALLGRWVNFEGWLLFDEEHASQAENTNPGRERNWRATAWEIHPVTNFKVVTKPK